MKFRLTLMLFVAIEASAEGPGAFVLKDARIVRVSGPTIQRGTVLIHDGLIEAVDESVPTPTGAWVIDAQGMTVYPGLIDALSTWGIPANGNARGGEGQPPAKGPEDRPLNTSWAKAADQIVPTDRNIQTVRDGGFTTAVSFPRGNIFCGQGSVLNLAGDRAGEMVIADSVAQLITLRTSGGRGFPSSLMGSIAYVRQVYSDAGHYQNAKAVYDKHPEGLRRPAYDRALEGVLVSPRVLLPAETDVEIERMLAVAAELKLKTALYGGHEAWRAPDLLKRTNTPVLISLKYPEKPRDADPAQDEPLRVLQFRDKAPSAAGVLAQAGVKFAFYSDGITNPRDLMRAVRKAIDAGLSQDDAVRALTLSPAEIYGIADRTGSIDKGKIANLVVTDGDLFAEKTRIKYVFVDGMQFQPLAEEPAGRAGRGGAQ